MDSFNRSRRPLLFIETVSDFIEYLVYRSIEIYATDQQCFATATPTHITSTMSVLNRNTDSASSECEEEIIEKPHREKISSGEIMQLLITIWTPQNICLQKIQHPVGHKIGKKIENRNSTICKSVSKCNYCMQLHSTTAFTDQ